MDNNKLVTFENGEKVIVDIGSRENIEAIYECQTRYSSNPDNDRFRVKISSGYEYVGRRKIRKPN